MPENQMFPVCPTAFLPCQTPGMPPNLEERIQQLCSQLAATQEDEELYRLCGELRSALNHHIRQLQRQVDQYRNALDQASRKGEPGDVG
jgi:hypothetical protein